MGNTLKLSKKQAQGAATILTSLIGRLQRAPLVDGDIHVAAEVEITTADLELLIALRDATEPTARSYGHSDLIDGNARV